MGNDELLAGLAQRLCDGDAAGVQELAQEALARGIDPRAVLSEGLMAGMEVVGRDFKEGAIFIPEVIVAARAMHAGIDLLRPLLADTDELDRGTIVIGTVKGDLHDIGKKIVGVMMQGAGFSVVDLGHDVAPERFVAAVAQAGARLVGLSALLSTTMPMIRTTVEALRGAGLQRPVKVMIGGAPVTQEYADQVGADGYAPDAVSAVGVAERLIEEAVE